MTRESRFGALAADARWPVWASLRLYRGLGVSYWFFAQGRNSLTSQWSKEQVKDIEDQVGIITMKSSIWVKLTLANKINKILSFQFIISF